MTPDHRNVLCVIAAVLAAVAGVLELLDQQKAGLALAFFAIALLAAASA